MGDRRDCVWIGHRSRVTMHKHSKPKQTPSAPRKQLVDWQHPSYAKATSHDRRAHLHARYSPHNFVPGLHSALNDYCSFIESYRTMSDREGKDTVDSIMCLPFSAFTQALNPDLEPTPGGPGFVLDAVKTSGNYFTDKQVRLAAKRAHVIRMHRARGQATQSRRGLPGPGSPCAWCGFVRVFDIRRPSARPEGQALFCPRLTVGGDWSGNELTS